MYAKSMTLRATMEELQRPVHTTDNTFGSVVGLFDQVKRFDCWKLMHGVDFNLWRYFEQTFLGESQNIFLTSFLEAS